MRDSWLVALWQHIRALERQYMQRRIAYLSRQLKQRPDGTWVLRVSMPARDAANDKEA